MHIVQLCLLSARNFRPIYYDALHGFALLPVLPPKVYDPKEHFELERRQGSRPYLLVL